MTMPVLILAAAFLLVFLLSLFISARVARHAGRFYSVFVHPFIALVSLYYLLDALFRQKESLGSPFAVFWIAVTTSQMGLFFYKKGFLKKQKELQRSL